MKRKFPNKIFPKVKGATVLRFFVILLLLLFIGSMVVSFQHLLSGSKTNPFIFDDGKYAIPRDLDRSYR